MNMLMDEQVENWRKILLGQIGPYALLMSREQIQAYRDRVSALFKHMVDTAPDHGGEGEEES